MVQSWAIFAIPLVAVVTYLFAFMHYGFKFQVLFFLILVVASAFLLTAGETETSRAVWSCIVLSIVALINVLRITAPNI